MISQNIGKNIAQLRKAKGITAEQLAKATKVSRQTISKWENGLTIPDAYNMVDIATFLDIPISKIYVQVFYTKDNKLSNPDFVEKINQILDPKNIEKAIIAYERNPNKFIVKIGVNVISYRDILLLSTNMGYFKGFSEIENPISYQNAKSENIVIPELVQCLKDRGFTAFYAGGDYNPLNNIMASPETTAENTGEQILVILHNEKDVLEFKTAIRELFTGITSVKCERNWASPSGMKYLLCMHDKNEDLEKLEKAYQNFVSSKDEFTEEEEKALEKAQKRIDELREEDIENCNHIQYVKDEQELSAIRKQLKSLDEKTMKDFAETCFGTTESIKILDLQTKKFLPL